MDTMQESLSVTNMKANSMNSANDKIILLQILHFNTPNFIKTNLLHM